MEILKRAIRDAQTIKPSAEITLSHSSRLFDKFFLHMGSLAIVIRSLLIRLR